MYRVFELSGKPSRLSLRKQWISPPLKAPLKWFATVTECASPAVFRYARDNSVIHVVSYGLVKHNDMNLY